MLLIVIVRIFGAWFTVTGRARVPSVSENEINLLAQFILIARLLKHLPFYHLLRLVFVHVTAA